MSCFVPLIPTPFRKSEKDKPTVSQAQPPNSPAWTILLIERKGKDKPHSYTTKLPNNVRPGNWEPSCARAAHHHSHRRRTRAHFEAWPQATHHSILERISDETRATRASSTQAVPPQFLFPMYWKHPPTRSNILSPYSSKRSVLIQSRASAAILAALMLFVAVTAYSVLHRSRKTQTMCVCKVQTILCHFYTSYDRFSFLWWHTWYIVTL